MATGRKKSGKRDLRQPESVEAQKPSLRIMSALLEDVQRESRERSAEWVMVHDIAARLCLEDNAVEKAAEFLIDKGYLVETRNPAHCLRLGAAFSR
jgi:hypothetical protein